MIEDLLHFSASLSETFPDQCYSGKLAKMLQRTLHKFTLRFILFQHYWYLLPFSNSIMLGVIKFWDPTSCQLFVLLWFLIGYQAIKIPKMHTSWTQLHKDFLDNLPFRWFPCHSCESVSFSCPRSQAMLAEVKGTPIWNCALVKGL